MNTRWKLILKISRRIMADDEYNQFCLKYSPQTVKIMRQARLSSIIVFKSMAHVSLHFSFLVLSNSELQNDDYEINKVSNTRTSLKFEVIFKGQQIFFLIFHKL